MRSGALDPLSHEPHEVEGWLQVGSIANGGYKYGTWVRELKGHHASIQQGEKSKTYWAKYYNCYYGQHKTPEAAARVLEKEAELDER